MRQSVIEHSVINFNKWTVDLDNININKLHPKVKCEFLMIVEETPMLTKKVKMIEFYSKILSGAKIFTISLKDVHDFIDNEKTRPPYCDDRFCEIYHTACAEAEVYVHIQKPIPIDLLIKIIKLKVIVMIKEFIYLQQKEATFRQQKDYFEAPVEEKPESKKKDKKGKKDKNEKKEKSGKSKSTKSKDKKGQSKEELENPCDQYQYIPAEDIPPNADVNIPNSLIYVALIGFYTPQLITYCYSNGMPLSCVVKFEEAKSKPSRFLSQKSTESIHYEHDVLILRPSVKYMPKQELQKKKEQMIAYFWRKVGLMYNKEKVSYINDSVIMNFVPQPYYPERKNPKQYFHQSEHLYEDFLKFIEKLGDYKQQYDTYMKNLKVCQLDVHPKKVEVYDMSIYKNAMDSVPIDTVNVSLILEYLIEEVCHRESEIPKTFEKLEETTRQDLKKQSHYLELEDQACHRSLRDQLKRIFLHFKTAQSRYLPKNPDCKRKFAAKVNDKPYITHECNLIEMTLNYYKYLPKSIFDSLSASLQKRQYLGAFDEFSLTDLQVSQNEREIRELCALLDVSRENLKICLSVILVGMIGTTEVNDFTTIRTISEESYNVQKTVHEIQANIPTYTVDQKNSYEKVRPMEIKWVDKLSPIVALQELARASEEFAYMTWTYVELFDLMLYRFHHSVDDFGINTRFWKERIRSPVSFKDFMTYVVHTDFTVILEQEDRRKDAAKLCSQIKEIAEDVNDFEVQPDDFVLPGSFKYNFSKAEQEEVTTPETSKKDKKDKKGGKKDEKKKSEPNSKSKSSKASEKDKGKSKGETFDAHEIVEGEPLKAELDSFQCGSELLDQYDPPPKIDAIDFNGSLLTSSGITTSFYSFDDLKVIVDQVQLCDGDIKLSIKVGLNGHDLILHRTFKGGFSFLVNFKSGVVLACGRPDTNITQTENDFYLVTEETERIANCMRSVFTARKNLMIDDNTLRRIIKHFEYDVSKKSLNASFSNVDRGSILLRDSKYKSLANTTTKQISSQFKKSQPFVSLNEDRPFSKANFFSEVRLLKRILDGTNSKFKVLSSSLHKYNFVRRITTPVELSLNEIIRFVSRIDRKNKRHLTVKRHYKIKTKPKNLNTSYDYDFRITLPSGLHLRNIVGDRGSYICQHYFEKSAICTPIFEEECRLFLGNGTVVIKQNDGKFIIYSANGEVIKYETTVFKNEPEDSMFYKTFESTREVSRFLKHVRRKIYKHTKKDNRSSFMSSRRTGKNETKRYHCGKQKRSSISDIKFSFITSEGRLINYENGVVKQSTGYYVEKEEVTRTGQVFYRREDGTTSVLTKEGHMQTTFPDGTKITVWCEVDPELVTVDLSNIFGPECEDMGPFVKVFACYQFEHPYYITLLSNGPDEKIMLRIASGEIFDISDKHFLVGIDEWTSLFANREIVRFVGTPCDECKKYCECQAYIEQLYNSPLIIQDQGILLKVSDTYDKSFIVHYDGSSKRNEDYDKKEKRCRHNSHRIQPSQAFFTLNRDYSGCALWTDDDYKKRLSEADDYDTNYLVFYVDKNLDRILTTEWKIFQKQHYNFRFIWPQSKIEEDEEDFDISSAAFIKQRIVKRIPPSVVRNLLNYIFDENNDKFSKCSLDLKRIASDMSSFSTSSFDDAKDRTNIDKINRKAVYEKKINKRNMECLNVIDKIIEYFAKKTGRYYRSKVYEDFCGVKLLLDDEEEIFFLANFDANTRSPSGSELVVSDTTDSLANNEKQTLPQSTEMMKSKISKSTSAVDTAVEVIKQLEMERQEEIRAKLNGNKTSSIEDTESTPKFALHQSFPHKLFSQTDSAVGDDRLLSPGKNVDETKGTRKSNISEITDYGLEDGVVPAMKTSSSGSEIQALLHQHMLVNEPEPEELSIMMKKRTGLLSITSITSSTDSDNSLEGNDIDEMLTVISQTLKRIQREQFDGYEQKENNRGITDEKRTSKGNAERSKRENLTIPNGIIHDLFGIPRSATVHETYVPSEKGFRMKSVSFADKCHSNFSFKDVGMADYIELEDAEKREESEEMEIGNVEIEKETTYTSEQKPVVQTVSSVEKKMPSFLTSDKTVEKTVYPNFVVQSDTSSSFDSVSSVQGLQELDSNSLLLDTGSFIPLLTVKSRSKQYSETDIMMTSLVPTKSNDLITPSMRVLRRVSEVEKGFDMIIVENTGIVTDKNKTKEVQTDIIYEEFGDGE